MHTALIIVVAIAVIGWTIYRQLVGEPLRGRRVVLLPAVLVVIGAVNLHSAGHLHTADIACIAASAVLAAAIGLGQGFVIRLESRDGGLWGQMPRRGLWLWGALIASRLVVAGIAVPLHAHAVTTSYSILLALGVNRLTQAAVIAWRAMEMGVPFSPEKDGKAFLPGFLGQTAPSPTAPSPTAPAPSSAPSPAAAAATVLRPMRARRHDHRGGSLLRGVAQQLAERLDPPPLGATRNTDGAARPE